MMIKKIIIYFLMTVLTLGPQLSITQEIFERQTEGISAPDIKSYQISRQKYISDNEGNILMYVNVWGHVNKPGSHLVFDGIDLVTLISVVGGPRPGADLKKVRLFREIPDENGKVFYEIDLENFFKNGDRSNFVKVLPNDTYIFPQTTTSYILSNMNTLSTVLSMANLYFTMLYYRDRTK